MYCGTLPFQLDEPQPLGFPMDQISCILLGQKRALIFQKVDAFYASYFDSSVDHIIGNAVMGSQVFNTIIQ